MSEVGFRHQCRSWQVALIDQAFRASGMAWLLHELRVTRTDCYLVGGAVRDMILGVDSPADLDLMVPNYDTAVHEMLGRHGAGRRNRHGNWRYTFPSGLHVDVIEPRFFYCQFESPQAALAFFDTSVNSLGLRLHDGHLLNPRCGLQDLLAGQVHLAADRWTTMNDFESVHLTLRLFRLIEKHPLRIVNPSMALAHVEKFETVEWDELSRLNGVNRIQAQAAARAILGYQHPVAAANAAEAHGTCAADSADARTAHRMPVLGTDLGTRHCETASN